LRCQVCVKPLTLCENRARCNLYNEFLPNMDAARLVEGYRSVLKRIYFCEACYERVKLYLNRTQARLGEPKTRQRWSY
jgi:hypothetical protein